MPEVVSEEGDHLPVKFNDPKFKNEIFVNTSVCNPFAETVAVC